MWSVHFLAYPSRLLARMKFLLLCVIVAITVHISSCQNALVGGYFGRAKCSPWLGLCHETEDCCRHLVCLTYRAKCVPRSGLIIPGEDQRPIGTGPFPPNYPHARSEDVHF
ncbi:uncharacterized protein LOC143260653 [Megalopta genalis]|uniref:uncharacterized protein LOC143260653 n=1 Tax=Megalopta genalis TaxID=115081 RepID=UPI003FD1075A